MSIIKINQYERVNYASPKLLKVSAVPSLGGEVILIAKNVGLKGDAIHQQ